MTFAASALYGVTAFAACKSSTGDALRCANGADIGLAVRDASSSTPAFDWDSACPAWRLDVAYDTGGAPFTNGEPSNTFVTVWSITGPNADNVLHSPVTYGTVPAGAYALVSAVPLIAGRTYRVGLYGRDPFYQGHAFGENVTFTR